MGNAAENAHVGMLFIDFENQKRLRVNGVAEIDSASLGRPPYPEAQFVVRVSVRQVFPNCPRYIHKLRKVEPSKFVPRPSCRDTGTRLEAHGLGERCIARGGSGVELRRSRTREPEKAAPSAFASLAVVELLQTEQQSSASRGLKAFGSTARRASSAADRSSGALRRRGRRKAAVRIAARRSFAARRARARVPSDSAVPRR